MFYNRQHLHFDAGYRSPAGGSAWVDPRTTTIAISAASCKPAFRQGANELGAALKAFPDSIQIDEPGTAFNPLYRDMAGDTRSTSKAPAWGRRQASPSPSEIAQSGASPGSVYGEMQPSHKSLHRLRRSPTIQRRCPPRSKATCTGRIWAARCDRFRPRMALLWRNPAMNEQTDRRSASPPHRNIEAGWCLFPSTEKHSRMGRCNLLAKMEASSGRRSCIPRRDTGSGRRLR